MLKGIFWDLLDKVFNQGIGFVISIVLARLLTPEDFGLVGMVLVIVGFSQIFMDLGFSTALVQKQEVSEQEYSTVFYLNVLVGALLSLLTFLSAEAIAAFYEQPTLVTLIQGISVIFLINSVTIVQNAHFLRAINLRPPAIYRAITVVISGGVGIAMALNGYGVWSLVVQNILSSFVFAVLIWIGSSWRPMLYFKLSAIKDLWNYGSKIFLSGFLENVFNRLDIVIIGKIFSPASLGFYTRAQSLNAMVIQYSSESLMKVFLPAISQNQHDTPKVTQIYTTALSVVSFMAFGLVSLLYVIAENLIVVLFTEKWLTSATYFQILVLGGFVYPLSAVMVNVLGGRGKSGKLLVLQILKKIILAFAFIIGFQIGIEAFLYSVVIAYLLSILLNMYYVTGEIQIGFMTQASIMLPYLAMGAIAALTAMVFSYYISLPRLPALITETAIVGSVYLLLNLLVQSKAVEILKSRIPVLKKS
jgi:teichuronic acid exporter